MSEWKKAIAIDFDGCLCAHDYPRIGPPNWDVITRAKQEQDAGAGLILWTCREGQLLQDAIDACARWGLHFDAVNESLPEWIDTWNTRPRKVGATEYWDDRAIKAASALCPLCAHGHLDGVGVRLDSTPHLYFSGGSNRPPEAERIKFCPQCGRRLDQEAAPW